VGGFGVFGGVVPGGDRPKLGFVRAGGADGAAGGVQETASAVVLSGRGAGNSRVPFDLCKESRSFSLISCAIFKFNSSKCRSHQRNFPSELRAGHVLARSIFISIILSSSSSIFTLVYTYIYIFDSVYSGGGRCLRLSGVLLGVASKHRGSVAAESLWPVARWL
jgi:hypothetical protein